MILNQFDIRNYHINALQHINFIFATAYYRTNINNSN